jgi:GAF domain-containing protein
LTCTKGSAAACYIRFLISHLDDRLQANKIIALLEAEHAAVASLVAGATLPCALEKIVREAEAQSDDDVAACILLQDDADRFVSLVAPNFPAAYRAILLESGIGPRGSPFGIAGFLGAPVFSGDIGHDQSWTNGRGAALSHGYRACWAAPIFSAKGIILGVLGMMFSSPRHPTQAESDLLILAARTSSHVIERHEYAEMRIALLSCEANVRKLAVAAAQPVVKTILVTTGDGMLQTTLQHALGRLDCCALQAGNAERAMIILSCGIEIDLLLIHVAHAGELDALELARQAKRLLPGLQIMFMSGGRTDAKAPVCAAELVFCMDPLNRANWIDALQRKLGELLAGNQESGQAQASST